MTRQDLIDAVVEGALLRVRPKVMTVAAIIGGLLPIMVGSGTGSEVMRRIAAPMVGGMASAAVLTLVVIPAVFLLWKRHALRKAKVSVSGVAAAVEKKRFVAIFNTCGGQGRSATTSTDATAQPAFIRTSAPDANACAGCHTQPRIGGAGDFVANAFVLAQAKDPVIFSVGPEDSSERNTLGVCRTCLGKR